MKKEKATNKELNRLAKLMELALDRFTPVEIFEALTPYVNYDYEFSESIFEALQNDWSNEGIAEQLTDYDNSIIIVSAQSIYDKAQIKNLLSEYKTQIITQN